MLVKMVTVLRECARSCRWLDFVLISVISLQISSCLEAKFLSLKIKIKWSFSVHYIANCQVFKNTLSNVTTALEILF